MAGKKTLKLQTLATLVDQVAQFGDHPAVVQFTREGRIEWTCERLAEEAGRLAKGLVEGKVKKGEPVAIQAEPSAEWFVAGLAVLRIGAVLVPIDTQMSDQDLKRVFDDCGARRVFTTARLSRRLAEVHPRRKLELYLFDPEDEEEEYEGDLPGGHRSWRTLFREQPAAAVAVAEHDRALLFYTSGTTGPPKGVPLSHRNIAYQIEVVKKTGLVRAGDRMLLPLPLHHVYPLVIGVFTTLGLGVVILLPHALTGDAIVRALSEGKGSIILGVPRLYRALYEGIRAKVSGGSRVAAGLFAGAMMVARASRRVGLPLGRVLFRPIRKKMGPRVRLLASGGSPLDPELAENLEAIGWPVAVGYGLTETSPLLTIKYPGEGGYTSVGRPIEGVELKIDPAALPRRERQAQESGRTQHRRGEVLARGPNVFHGYHKLPQKTKKSLEDGWFRTGDLGYIDRKGFLHLGGRASSMIVLEGGENINPEELEKTYGEAPEVAEIGILAEKGKLVALAVPDRSVLRQHGRDEVPRVVRRAIEKRGAELASYKRLSNVEITRESLPMTRLGKVKRHLLAERYEAARRGEGEDARLAGPVPVEQLSGEDRALLENRQARKMWDLLSRRYADRRLAPEANLGLDLGIDSLEWVELSLSAGQQAGVAITEDLIEKVETVRDLLEAAASAGTEELGEGKRPIESPEKVLSRSDQRWAKPSGPLLRLVARALFGLLRVLLGARGCRVTVRGRENLPEAGSFIVVPNHVSFLDSPALLFAFGRERFHRFFWAGQGGIMFRGRLRRLVSRLFQVVPIDPRRGPLSSLAVGALVVKRGHPLVWFAEGQVSKDGRLQSFQPGIGLIINHYEPTVVPAFLEGTYESMPLGKKLPRAGRLVVHFGKPIEGKVLKARAGRRKKGEIHQRIAQVLHDEVAELAQSIQGESEPNGDQSRKAA